MALPTGIKSIDTVLTNELTDIANDPDKNPRNIHAVVLLFKDKAAQMYVPVGTDLQEVPDYPSGGQPAARIMRIDYVSALVYQRVDGVDPQWYLLNGRRVHTP